MLGFRGHLLQLNQQALANIAGKYTGRVKLLQPVQYGNQLIFLNLLLLSFQLRAFRLNMSDYIQQTLINKSRAVDGIDKGLGDLTVPVGKGSQV